MTSNEAMDRPTPGEIGIDLLPAAEIAGVACSRERPLSGFVVRPDLGILVHRTIEAKCVHAWAPPLNFCTAPRVALLPSGDYLLATVGGTGHMWHDRRQGDAWPTKPNDLLLYRSSDRGRSWRGPLLPFRKNYGHNSSVPFVPPGSRRVYLFSTEVSPAWAQWPDGGIAMRHSDDDGWTWSRPRLIEPVNAPGFRGQAHMQMTCTNRGTWLIGSYRTRRLAHGPQRCDRQYVLRSTDEGESWTLLPGREPQGWFVPGFNYMLEGRPLALDGPNVLFWGRTPAGHSYEFRSADDGLTWSQPKPVPLVHPDAPPMVWTLRDGATMVALIHNRYDPESPQHNHTHRNELWLTLSTDGAHTWSEPRLLLANFAETGPSVLQSPQVSYCDLLIDAEELHVFVDWQCRQIVQGTIRLSDLEDLPTHPA